MADLDLQPECNREMIETLFGTDVNHNIDPEGLLETDSKCSGSDELAALMEGQTESELLNINNEQEPVHKEPEMITGDPTKLPENTETSVYTNAESKPTVLHIGNSGVLELCEAKEVNKELSVTELRTVTNQAQIQVSENPGKDKTTQLVEESCVNATENCKSASLSSTMDVATLSMNRELETCPQPAVKAASTDTSDRPQPRLPPHYSETKVEPVETVTVSTQAVHKPVETHCVGNSNVPSVSMGDGKGDVTTTATSNKDESNAFGLEWKDGIATLPGTV